MKNDLSFGRRSRLLKGLSFRFVCTFVVGMKPIFATGDGGGGDAASRTSLSRGTEVGKCGEISGKTSGQGVKR